MVVNEDTLHHTLKETENELNGLFDRQKAKQVHKLGFHNAGGRTLQHSATTFSPVQH